MPTTSRLGRREVLKRLLATGAGATAIVAAAPARADSHARRTERQTSLVVDVACLADTFRLIPAPDPSPPPDSPTWGAPFLVEGLIFEGGALKSKNGFDPRDEIEQAIGTWLCRGWVLIGGSDRSQPHVATTQQYLFPRLDGSATFPAKQLFSEGLEGLDVPEWDAPRAVIGGTGEFAGVRGTVTQSQIGANATMAGAGLLIEAGPNFRFSFDLDWGFRPPGH